MFRTCVVYEPFVIQLSGYIRLLGSVDLYLVQNGAGFLVGDGLFDCIRAVHSIVTFVYGTQPSRTSLVSYSSGFLITSAEFAQNYCNNSVHIQLSL